MGQFPAWGQNGIVDFLVSDQSSALAGQEHDGGSAFGRGFGWRIAPRSVMGASMLFSPGVTVTSYRKEVPRLMPEMGGVFCVIPVVFIPFPLRMKEMVFPTKGRGYQSQILSLTWIDQGPACRTK